MGEPPAAREALGMRVPPARVVAAASRVRARLQRAEKGMAPPFVAVVEGLLGLVDAKALWCAVELRIPDILGHGEMTIQDLALETGADADALRRLLRFLVSRGFFATAGPEKVRNNARTDILRSDHPFSARAWVEFFGSDWNAEIWNHLGDRLRGKSSAVEATFGVPFFEYVNETNPDAGAAFNGAMSVGSRLQAILFGENVDLSGVATLCDLGGGSGAVLTHLLRVRRQMHGTIYDLPALEPDATTMIRQASVTERCRFVAGDFFESVPSGHDAYTLFAIVHDWDDHAVQRILGNVRKVAQAARVFVVEKPLPGDDRPDFAKVSDMLMLAFGDGGRERTDAEYETLFAASGYSIRRRTLLPSLFCVYELAATMSRP